MEQILKFGLFTLVPTVGLATGIAYSLREIHRIGERRIYVVVLILGFMLFHQSNEMASFIATGEYAFPVVGEVLETSANLIAAGSVYYVLSFGREQRQLKNELEQSQAATEQIKDRLELIFDNVNDGILLVNLDDMEIVDANRPAHELLRYEYGELEGMSPYDIHPHEPERFRKLTEVLQPDGGVISDNLSCRRSDGSTMPAAVSASRTDLDGTDLMLVTIRDNTTREQYRTQVDLLGRVLRHNLRNDMTVVMGQLDAVKERCDDPKAEDFLDRSIQKCRELIDTGDKTRKLNDILDSERDQFGRLVDLVTVIEELVAEYEKGYPDATIETDLPASATVRASHNVRWAIENLLENAIIHDERDPRVHISIDSETTETEGQRTVWTTVTVADEGPGIPENEVSVLRDDTERTPIEHGSGLGLWIVQQIVEAFDGQIEIDRDPDGGFATAVTVRLQPAEDNYAVTSGDY
jgi:PAS domain S-box-containing protein